MTVTLLTEQHFESVCLKGGCTCSSESTLVKMPHCWKSHVASHILIFAATGNEELLNQLAYPILDDSVCKQHWDDFIPNTEICAGYVNQTKDFCGVSIFGAMHDV